MANRISVGAKIPEFMTRDHEGLEIASEDLLGSPFILYFYPKDDTPGCTKQACSFRDNMEKLDELNTIVIGVSPDNEDSHLHFINKHGLNFTLLCDEDCELARKFDVIQQKEEGEKKVSSILRSTFIVDSEGVIRWIEKPVSVEGHVDRVMVALRQNIK